MVDSSGDLNVYITATNTWVNVGNNLLNSNALSTLEQINTTINTLVGGVGAVAAIAGYYSDLQLTLAVVSGVVVGTGLLLAFFLKEDRFEVKAPLVKSKRWHQVFAGWYSLTNSGYYRWIVKLLGLKPGKTILDVSCGEGIFLREVLRKFKLTRASGLDISDIAVSIAKRRSPDPGFVVADGQRIPFKGHSMTLLQPCVLLDGAT